MDSIQRHEPMRIGSVRWCEVISNGAEKIAVSIHPSVVDQFARHAGELLRWNAKTNLTALTDPLEIAVHHFLDSAAVAPYILPTDTMLDIGSGGGFPGIPLKLLHPSIDTLLIDGSRKKVSFLKHLIRYLGLKNTDASHSRAESMAVSAGRPKRFSVIISRALADLKTFAGYALPLLTPEGRIIAMRGGGSRTEIGEVQRDVAEVAFADKTAIDRVAVQRHSYRLPYVAAERHLVVIRLLC